MGCWGAAKSERVEQVERMAPFHFHVLHPRIVMAEVEAGAALELRGLPPEIPDELLTLYFENHRRSGGGPLLSWQRLGCGGVLVFQDPAGEEVDLMRLPGCLKALLSLTPHLCSQMHRGS